MKHLQTLILLLILTLYPKLPEIKKLRYHTYRYLPVTVWLRTFYNWYYNLKL